MRPPVHDSAVTSVMPDSRNLAWTSTESDDSVVKDGPLALS